MRKLRLLAVIPLASLIACEPESPADSPKSPEINGSIVTRSSPPSIDTSIPGSNQSTVVVPSIGYPEWGSIPDDAFYHCEVLEEESDFCDEYFELDN